MFFDKPSDFKKIQQQSYGDLFKERGLKCCFYNVVIVCVFFFASPNNTSALEYGVFFLVSTLFDTISPKIVARFKEKSSEKKAPSQDDKP